MHRQPRPGTPQLQALLEERDHVRVLISLEVHAVKPDATMLERLRRALIDLEKLIERANTD